jgi:chromosome segregation ATPase
MRAMLYQIAVATEENASRGVPSWVVWILVIIIVLLMVFILIRDKRARKALKNIFSWITNKIRVARLKFRIGKKEEERSQMMIELGQVIWEKKIGHPEIEPERQEIGTLKNDESTLISQIQKLDDEIQQLKCRSEKADQDRKSRIAEIEKEKSPLENQYKELVREKDTVESRIKEDEKSSEKTIKSVENHKREIEKIDGDEYLSKIEKEMKRKEQEKEIENLKNQLPKMKERLAKSKEDQKKIDQNIDKLKEEIQKQDDRLDGLRKEWRERQKKDEDEIGNIQKNRKALSIKKIGIQKQLSALFEKLGEKINKNRIENEDLKPLYSQIDQLEKNIKELQGKMDEKPG